MSAQIHPTDSTLDRFSKLLPADVAATFISCKAALMAAFTNQGGPAAVCITFLIILCLCPLYFRKVTKVTDQSQIVFLTFSSFVFAISLASKEISNSLIVVLSTISVPTFYVDPVINGLAIVAPILWTALVSQIAATSFKAPATQPADANANPLTPGQ